MKKIAFICTGNTCRSPMAEVIARDIFKKRKLNIEVISRGIAVYFPSEANENSFKTVSLHGLDLSQHKAKQIDLEDINSCNIILTMTKQHKEFIKKMSTNVNINIANKLFTLKEYVKADSIDIADPYGEDIEVYKSCANELFLYIDRLADLLQ